MKIVAEITPNTCDFTLSLSKGDLESEAPITLRQAQHDTEFQHEELAQGRWFSFSLMEQLGNIGSEVSRAISWKNKGEQQQYLRAFHRALELIYLTVEDKKNRKRLREILMIRETLCDFFIGENQFKSTDESWQKYFLYFAYAARKNVS